MGNVLAIDQGTTGTTVLVVADDLRIVGRGYREFPQIFPKPGWVEHDPEDIWRSVNESIALALRDAKMSGDVIDAIGITNQRETTVLWDRKNGNPEANAIVWQDRRTSAECERLKSAGKEEQVKRETGLVLDPYFSGTKLSWLLNQDSDRRAKAQTGTLCFGTIDSYLVYKLTGGVAHVTDVSNASRTLLFSLERLAWSPDLLTLFDIPDPLLPEVRTSAEVYGETRGLPGLRDGIPISGMAGDQQSALFGQACFNEGEAKCTYGTGSFILMNTGAKPVHSSRGLLSTVAWQIGAGDDKGTVAYALEGASFIAGAAVQWLRDGLGLLENAADIEAMAAAVPDTGEVMVVPAFAGLGAPHWRPEARGIITGITRGTTANHIARATLEGIALQQADIVQAMAADSGRALQGFKVDGGAAKNNLLMQLQADILGTTISRPAIVETTAMGAAFLAGLGVGIWKNTDAIKEAWRQDRVFTPEADPAWVQSLLQRWQEAVAKA